MADCIEFLSCKSQTRGLSPASVCRCGLVVKEMAHVYRRLFVPAPRLDLIQSCLEDFKVLGCKVQISSEVLVF